MSYEVNEEWRDIEGYEGIYQVSNYGRVKSVKRGIILKTFERKGYPAVTLSKDGVGRSYSVHRLVGEAFIPNPDNLPYINHKDETRDNNHVSNLEWCTASYNNTYGTKIKRGTETRLENYYGTLDEDFINGKRKERRKEAASNYYQNNKEKVNKLSREWRLTHLDKVKEVRTRWYDEHREEYNAYMRDYTANNKEKLAQNRKARLERLSAEELKALKEKKRAYDKARYIRMKLK